MLNRGAQEELFALKIRVATMLSVKLSDGRRVQDASVCLLCERIGNAALPLRTLQLAGIITRIEEADEIAGSIIGRKQLQTPIGQGQVPRE